MVWLALQNLYFLLIIPIILLLYLLKKKYEDQEISSILLWRKMILDIEANRWWKRLQKNLLLFLQLLFAILLILALLKPVLPTEQLIANHSIIVLDNSASMLTKEKDITRFELAKEEIQKRFKAISSNQFITLILAEEKPRVLIAKSSNKDQLRNILNSISINFGTTDDSAAFSLAHSIAMTEKDTGILWVSDGANQTFSKTERLSKEIPFHHLLIGSERENVAFTSFVTQEMKNGIQGMIKLDNTGSIAKQGKLYVYTAEKKLIDIHSFEIKGKSSYSYLLNSLPKSRYYYGMLEVEGDFLEQDNQLYSVLYQNNERTGILVTEGNRFLQQGLSLMDNFQLTNLEQVPDQMEEKADIWIFDRQIPTKLPEGNLLIIAPTQSTPWWSYLGEKEGQGTPEVVKKDHSVNQHVPWDQVYINKLIKLENVDGLETLVRLGDEPVVTAGIVEGRKIVILHFDLQQSDMSLRPAFPIFLHNVVQWLTPKQSLPIGNAIADELITVPFTANTTDRKIISPSGEETAIDINHGLNPLYKVPDQIGLYQISEKNEAEELQRFFTVSINAEESNIVPKMINFSNIEANEDEQSNQITDNKNIGYRDLSYWFIWLALIILMLEGFFYYRGYE